MRHAWKTTFIILILCLVGAVAGRMPAARSGSRAAAKPVDCTGCHDCAMPTRDDPCLAACLRHQANGDLSPDLGPSVVILDELEDLYVPVRFDHHKHATMAGMGGNCETCHHFTPANSTHPECKSCHPREIIHEDISQPGLKGAYHRLCLRCHTEWDRDTKCEVCHEKKAGGRLEGTTTEICEHSHYEPVELKELIIFDTSYAKGPQVPFHHRNHSTLYERDCSECHQQQSCTRCHVQKQELHPMGQPTETDLHDVCFTCHHRERCGDCHGRDPDDLFNHRETGWPLKTYHASLNCRACHGQRGPFMQLSPDCAGCHPNGWKADTFRHQVTGVALGEVHGSLDCGDCHTAGVGKPADCSGCHDDGRVYDAKRGFGGV